MLDSGQLDWSAARVAEDAADADGADETPVPVSLAESMSMSGDGPRGRVALAVETGHVLLRVVRLPVASQEELKGMVDLQVDKYSPFPIDTLAVGFEVLVEDDDGLLVLIGAVREDEVEGLRQQLADAELEPHGVDAEIMGWWELILRSGRDVPAGLEICVLLTPTIQIIAANDGVPLAFRSLALLLDSPPGDLAVQLCEEIEYTVMSLELGHGVLGRPSVSLWSGGDEPSELVGAMSDGVDGDISLGSLDSLPPVSEGLALRALDTERRRLDITPGAWRRAESARSFKKTMFIAGGACLAVWALTVGALAGGYLFRQTALSELETAAGEWMTQANEVREMRRRVFTLKKYTNQTHSALECLREVSSSLADGIDLTSFSFRKADTVRLTGASKTVNQIYAFKRRLDHSQLFGEAELDAVRKHPRKQLELFEMVIKLPGDES